MVKTSASAAKKDVENPEATERKRLKKLASKKNILSDAPARGFAPLAPSKQVIKHHGKDIIKKSQRKNRFLFSFPGLLAPVAGGKIGELKDLGTKNPILYLDFPQGQMKLFGTIVYPKNRYLSLQFSRGGKNVMCEDNFENMEKQLTRSHLIATDIFSREIVFSDAWWIGTKDENPEEARLDFPKDLTQGQLSEYDFQGGAGSGVLEKRVSVTVTKNLDSQSTEETGDDLSEDTDLKPKLEVTPTRHSGRNAGKKFKFVDSSSEDEKGGAETPDGEEKKSDSEEEEKKVKSGNSPPAVFDIESENATDSSHSRRIQSSLAASTKSGKISTSAITIANSKRSLGSAKGSFVQTTISTLFSKVEKKVPKDSEKSSSIKGSRQKAKPDSSTKDEQSVKKREVVKGKKSGIRGKKKDEMEEEDIEEFSSSSKATDESDEDWTA